MFGIAKRDNPSQAEHPAVQQLDREKVEIGPTEPAEDTTAEYAGTLGNPARTVRGLVFYAVVFSASSCFAADGPLAVPQYPTSVYIVSIVASLILRVSAIAGGIYIVWLGHNTLIRGVKGEFEFKGSLGRLKGSAPGLLFVLLGSMVIGWALFAEWGSERGQKLQQNAAQHNPVEKPIPPKLINPFKSKK